MRIVAVIRHAHSTANTIDIRSGMTAEGLAFANRVAELTDAGKRQCLELRPILPTTYGIEVSSTRVAVSEYVRTQQSAKGLKFEEDLTEPYPQLNEVNHGMEIGALRAMLR
jgi:broad specificity phosphatase PhoE